MTLRNVHDFMLRLDEACVDMFMRGVRVDETRREQMIADLDAMREPSLKKAQDIILPLLEELRAAEDAAIAEGREVSKRLPNRSLFEDRWTCPCCRGGKLKVKECWSCAGFSEKPTKKLLGGTLLTRCLKCKGMGKSVSLSFKPSSPKQLKTVLYSILRLPKRYKTTTDSKGKKRKGLTTDEAALKSLRPHDKSGLIDALLQIAKTATMRGILVRIGPHWYHCPARDFSGECECETDCRIRTSYNVAGTETGRFSSSGGHPDAPLEKPYALLPSTNLSNLPKKTVRDPRYAIRKCLVPNPGMAFVEADLSGAEAWVTAALCGDDPLLDKLRAGMDVHRWTAAQIFNKEMDDVTPEERFLGKRARHALNYGMGWKRFQDGINDDADETGISITAGQAKRIVISYHNLHPSLQGWWRTVLQQGGNSLSTLFGRKRTFFGRRVGDRFRDPVHLEAVAYDPQSTIADLLNRGLLRWRDRYDDKLGRLLLQVYDSVLVECKIALVSAVKKALQTCLSEKLTINDRTFTIPVDVSWSDVSWGDLK